MIIDSVCKLNLLFSPSLAIKYTYMLPYALLRRMQYIIQALCRASRCKKNSIIVRNHQLWNKAYCMKIMVTYVPNLHLITQLRWNKRTLSVLHNKMCLHHNRITQLYIWCILQEEELRKSSDPKYQHLNDDLHVEITAFAPPSEAHARIAYALTEVILKI